MYDKSYVVGLRIREIDGGGSSDDFSMTSLMAADLLPKMKQGGTPLTDQSVALFI